MKILIKKTKEILSKTQLKELLKLKQKELAKRLYTFFSSAKTAIPTLWTKTIGNMLWKTVKVIRLSSTYHRSDKTPLYRFTEALKGNLKALKRFPWGDAKFALMFLYDDYGIISGNKHYINEIRNIKKSALIYNRIIMLRMALYLNDNKIIRKLTGTTSIKAAEGVLKIWITEYQKNNIQKNVSANTDIKEGFGIILAEISKHMGFRINPQKVTVAEFASMVGNYTREIESKKQYYGK